MQYHFNYGKTSWTYSMLYILYNNKKGSLKVFDSVIEAMIAPN